MTTIIIVVVVALVFFVALCVVTFMVWKREEEMRTDSLRSIESNLQELGYRMTGDFSRAHSRRRLQYEDYDSIPYREAREHRAKPADPFGWTREDVAVAGAASQADAMGRDPIMPEHSGQSELAAYEDVYAAEGAKDAEESRHPEGTDQAKAIGTTEDAKDKAGQEPAPIDVEKPVPEDVPSADAEAAETPKAENADILEDPAQLEDFERFEEYAEQLDMEALRNSLAEAGDSLKPVDESSAPEPQTSGEDAKIDAPEPEPAENGTDGYVADYIPDDMQTSREIGRDIGRSGRKYTAEELDMLIRD